MINTPIWTNIFCLFGGFVFFFRELCYLCVIKVHKQKQLSMSYSILYNAIAVRSEKDPNKFIIISQRGDNNVYDGIAGMKNTFHTWEEIESNVNRVDFESGCYQIYGKRCLDGEKYRKGYLAAFKKAVKNAKTFAEYRSQSLASFSISIWDRYDHKGCISFESETELDNRLTENAGKDCFIIAQWVLTEKIFPKKMVGQKKVSKQFYVRIKGRGFLSKMKGSKFLYSYVAGESFSKAIAERHAARLTRSGYECQVIEAV